MLRWRCKPEDCSGITVAVQLGLANETITNIGNISISINFQCKMPLWFQEFLKYQ